MNLANFTAELSFGENEAQAALSDNPNVRWAKFVFTDDQPNGNKQRIPKEEFPNILRTGVFMPIKMASGKIEDGHSYAEPLGVISHLREDANQVLGLAAFWIAEREDDINLLKTMTEINKNPQLSWEVWYENSSTDESGIEDLHGVVVRATTIVGKPAYQGRTPILAMSSETASDSSEEIQNQIEESSMELEEKVKALETMLETLKLQYEEESAKVKEELEKTKCELDSATQNRAELQSALDAANSELTELRSFKQKVDELEAEVARLDAEAAKLTEIKGKFETAGISKDETYFEENKEKLLVMEESVLEFLIQEMSMFKATQASQNTETIEVPNLVGEQPISQNPKELGRLLRENRKQKDN